MVSSAIELLLDEAQDINLALQQLIDHFHTMNLDSRLKQSTEIFDSIRLFFARHNLVVSETAVTDVEYQRFEDAHQKALDVYERMVMIHVEEEDYFARLQQLQEAFGLYTGDAYKLFLSHIQQRLTPEEQNTMAKAIQTVETPR